MNKEFITVPELRALCEKLNLPSNGIKHELIKRLNEFDPTVAYSTSCRCDSQSTTSIIQTADQSTQTMPTTAAVTVITTTTRKFWKALILFGVIVGILALAMQLFPTNEKIEVPIKRSWF